MAYQLFAYEAESLSDWSHPLWRYGRRFQGFTILVNEDEFGVEYAEGFQEPDDQAVQTAKRAYTGGVKYLVSDTEAAFLVTQGFGDYLEPA
jgi:hypothetical protein